MHNAHLALPYTLRPSHAVLYRLFVWLVITSLLVTTLPPPALLAAQPTPTAQTLPVNAVPATAAALPPCQAALPSASVFLPLVANAPAQARQSAATVPTADQPTSPSDIACQLTLAEDSSTSFALSQLVTGAATAPPNFVIQSAPTHGHATVQEGVLTYTPAPDFYGADALTYLATPAQGAPSGGTIHLHVTPVNDAPTFTLFATPTTGPAPLDVALAGQAADVDGDPLTFVWSLGDGATAGNQAALAHRYAQPGSYTVVGTVSDGQVNASAQVTITVTEATPAHQPPLVTLSANPAHGFAPLEVTFAASASSPDNLPLTYIWDFGDGTTQVGPITTTHRYQQTGLYTATVTVSDGRNAASAQVLVEATSAPRVNQPPVVVLSATPPSGLAPVEITFVATANDPDGDRLSYTWLFGDGATAYDNPTITHQYSQAGIYTATVTVSDGQASVTAQTAVLIQPPPPINQPPQLQLTADPSSGLVPLAVTFSATANDAEGQALTYLWALGDGSTASTGPTLAHLYSQPGIYTPTVTVSDGQATTTAQTHITVLAPPNQPPAVVITATPTAGVAPLDVAFVAQAADPNNDELTYVWSFGDGATSGNGQAAAHRYEQPGTYTALLTVSDGQATVSAQVVIQVTAPPPLNFPPSVVLTVTAASDYAPKEMLFVALAADPDNDGLTYSWDFGDGASAGNNATVTHRYSQSGLYTATVTVSDGQAVASTQASIVVEAALAVSLYATPTSGPAPLDVAFSASASDPLTYTWDFGDWTTVAGGATANHRYAQAGVYTATVTASDGQNRASAQVAIVVSSAVLDLTPSAVDATVPTSLWRASQFLYTGDNSVQQGVTPATIDPQRVAVIRGKVLDTRGEPLRGVHVDVLNHPELGSTQTRSQGLFDLVVNGGGYLTLNFSRDGYLPVQRQVQAPWQDYAVLDDIVLTALDPAVAVIDLTASTPIQVARGSVISDTDGIRQSTLLIPQGTQAELVLPDGSKQPISTLHIRATEYTVGDLGLAAMPGSLPPESAYTYAAELSVDEALAVGATDVRFSQTLYHYVENFLNFPVGMNVPVGYYDRVQATWVASPNGRVVKIVAIAGALADVDTNGDGVADNDAALGITTAERAQLAQLYQPGQSLWRVPLTHFTPWDHNWPFGFPADAIWANLQDLFGDDKTDNPCEVAGSIIECESQVVGERIDLVGVPYNLNYRSDRTPGRKPYLDIPVSGSSVPPSLRGIELEVEVGGQLFQQHYPPTANQNYLFYWDNLDIYGRTIQGNHPAKVRIGYTYPGVYQQPATGSTASFAEASGVPISGSRTRRELTMWQEDYRDIGVWDARGLGLGGWSLDIHHLYDPMSQVLYLGDGQRRRVEESYTVVTTAAGNGQTGLAGDNGPALQAQLRSPQGIAVGPDGSLYIADSYRIRRVNPDGVITTIAGTGTRGFSGDGGPAIQAQLDYPGPLALGPDGSLYFYDTSNKRIRRITPDGKIRTVVGTGVSGYSGDGGLATAATINGPRGLVVAADGSLYIADTYNDRVRRVRPDGRIVTVAGKGSPGFSGDGGSARTAKLWAPDDVAIGQDGSLYIADRMNNRVRRVTPAGIISTVAGNGSFAFSGDGVATSVAVGYPTTIEAGVDGSLYIVHGGLHLSGTRQPHRIRRLWPDGRIVTFAGGNEGNVVDIPEGLPATRATLFSPQYIAAAPNGALYLSDKIFDKVRRINHAIPGFSGRDIVIPAEDGKELYHFSGEGRHLRTVDSRSGAVLYTFTYNSHGLLTRVSDGDGNSTTIERTSSGAPNAIVSPYGQRTTLQLDPHGFLARITNPAREAFSFAYSDGGLLTRMTDPRGNASTYAYDEVGRLERNDNAGGGFQTFTRIDFRRQGVYSVTKRNALGHATTHHMEPGLGGGQYTSVFAPNGAKTVTRVAPTGVITKTDARGILTTIEMGPDPRWGMMAPYVTRTTSRTPDGAIYFTLIATRTATLADARNPLSLITQTDEVTVNGRTTRTVLHGPTRIVTTTDPAGVVTVTYLDGMGRPQSVHTTDQAPVSYTYDPRGRLIEVYEGERTLPELARFTRLSYDSRGNLATVTDALRGVTTYAYDAAGRTSAQTLPTGQTLSFTYDAAGNVTSQVNAQGITTAYLYDVQNRVRKQIVDATGRAVETNYYYDLADNLITTRADTTDRRVGDGAWLQVTTHYTYTPFGPDGSYLLSQITDALGQVSSFIYSPAGDLLRQTVADKSTTFAYTAQGWQSQVTTPSGRTTRTQYNSEGQPVRTTDPRGGITTYHYDSLGRLQRVVAGTAAIGTEPALNQTTTFIYDAHGRVTTTTNGRGQSYTRAYDEFGRVANERDPLGTTTTYRYDKLDRLVRQTMGANQASEALTTAYTYDASGRKLTVQVDPDGLNLTTQYRYSQPGSSDTWNAQQVIDPRGNVTRFAYNSFGLLARTTDALGQSWSFAYDNLGRPLSQTDPLGHVTTSTVDKLGRTTARTEDGRTERWEYSAAGAMARYSDFAGRTTTYSYDDDQLLIGINYPEGMADVAFVRDSAGNVNTLYDGTGTTLYRYDVLNRQVERRRGGRAVTYSYDQANQLTALEYWGRGAVHYGYDNAGRPTTLTPWGAAPTTYSYGASGLLAGHSRANGIATTYGYDTAGRLTAIRHAQGLSEINHLRYTLDANGNRKRLQDGDGLTSYAYDALNRLSAVNYPALPDAPDLGLVDYTLDALGNRTDDGTTQFTYDASGRITNPGYSYDANGNLLSGGVNSYEYDAANRLIRSVRGGVATHYDYDGWGNLVHETANGLTTDYVWDERGALPRLLGAVRSDGSEELYAYGPEGFAAQRNSSPTATTLIYPLLDGLGSVRHLTDGSGARVQSRSYDVYGNLRRASGAVTTRLGYTGELQDASSGLVYLRARHYHPGLGRFLQRDTFAGFTQRPQSLNRYAYTENNPANLTDPSGHCPLCMIGVGAAAGAGMNYGSQVYQNYQNGVTGMDMFTQVNRSEIFYAGLQSGIETGVGLFLGPAAAGMVGGGSTLIGSIIAGGLEGTATGAITQILMNLVRGCAWNEGLGSAMVGGALSGGFGGGLGYGANRIENGLAKSYSQPGYRKITSRQPVLELRKIRTAYGVDSQAEWFMMGQNKVGTTFWGPDAVVFTHNAELIRAMDKHGPGIILDGSHGSPKGYMRLQPGFTDGTKKFFSSPYTPYSDQVTVIDITELTSKGIKSLGGPGQNVYVNWCWGGFCRRIRKNLTPPLEP